MAPVFSLQAPLAMTGAKCGPPAEGRFSEDESQALQTRASELKALAPFFRDGSLAWTHWGDLRSW